MLIWKQFPSICPISICSMLLNCIKWLKVVNNLHTSLTVALYHLPLLAIRDHVYQTVVQTEQASIKCIVLLPARGKNRNCTNSFNRWKATRFNHWDGEIAEAEILAFDGKSRFGQFLKLRCIYSHYSSVLIHLLPPLKDIHFFLVDNGNALNAKDLEWSKQQLPAAMVPE